MSVLQPILRHALLHPKRTAVIDDNRTYTYAKLVGAAMFMAEKIESATAKPHVGIMLPSSGAFPAALLGAWLARRVAVPLNFLLSKSELEHVVRDSGIDTIITAGPLLEFIGGDEMIPPGVRVVKMEEVDFTGVPPLRWPPHYGKDELATLLYTSGTSGKPKGVMLSHGNLRSNVDAALVHAKVTADDVLLGVLPQFHSFGLTVLTLMPLAVGAKVVYSSRFVPRKIVSLMRKHRPTVFLAVPSMYGALLSVKDFAPEDVASIRYAISGGEPLPNAVYDTYQERLKLRLLEGYGLTETAPATNWSLPERHRLHSVGPALPGVRIEVVDDNDRKLGPNEEGEIIISGPNVMQGYYHMPEETAAAIAELDLHDGTGVNRYLRTGDIGKVDTDGFLFITGRKKEMLIIAGENVFPREIEEVLNHHPAVKDSAVVGQDDGLRGEVAVAFVEIEPEQQFDESELRKWCRDKLANFKVPREIHVVDELPRNPTGKIMRRKLKERMTAQGE